MYFNFQFKVYTRAELLQITLSTGTEKDAGSSVVAPPPSVPR